MTANPNETAMSSFLDGAEVNPIPCLERDKAMRDDLIVVTHTTLNIAEPNAHG